MRDHHYAMTVTWTGNLGVGTSGYRSYSRAHEISTPGKPAIPCSSDPAFRGDVARYNPEEMLVASLSACHMLSYLHLCADGGLVVEEYTDDPTGTMSETAGGGGHFTEVVLRPRVVFRSPADLALAAELHEREHHLCFIASSVNFPVRVEPSFDRERLPETPDVTVP